MSEDKVLENFEKMEKVKDLALRNCLGIIPEDSDYIVKNIGKIFFTVYHVFNDYLKLWAALDMVGITADELREEYQKAEISQMSRLILGNLEEAQK